MPTPRTRSRRGVFEYALSNFPPDCPHRTRAHSAAPLRIKTLEPISRELTRRGDAGDALPPKAKACGLAVVRATEGMVATLYNPVKAVERVFFMLEK
ncbi:hypothetical protein [Candidatus Chlorohelix sp.]|uniref:hypothetical protein n=1 Tax=Candidatus Chlorohelix sp. TaxID=3139201 RepID=UPI0030749B00